MTLHEAKYYFFSYVYVRMGVGVGELVLSWLCINIQHQKSTGIHEMLFIIIMFCVLSQKLDNI
jgi:hypothetical protein